MVRPFEVRCSRLFGLCRLVPCRVAWSDGCFYLRDYFCGRNVGQRNDEVWSFLEQDGFCVAECSGRQVNDLIIMFGQRWVSRLTRWLLSVRGEASSNFCFCRSLILLKTR